MAKKKKQGLQVVGNIDFKDDKNGLKVVGKVDFDDNNNITNKTAFIQQQDIAPVKQTGFFNDAKGSTLQKIGNTAVDATGNILKGGLSAFEGISDFGRYRGADVLDFFGANEKAKKVRENAKQNITESIFTDIDHILSGDLAGKVDDKDLAAFQDINKSSFIGDKGSQVFQGVGNSATNAALSALGGNLAGMTSLFMSASGNAQSEAYQEGATDFQAGIYGALSGSVEAATEMMFGGLGKITQNLGFGTGALDDQLINRFTRKLSNTIAKNAVDLGLRSAGEGVEEVVAGFGNAILQKLTYMKDEDFSKLVKDQKLMDSFVSGALSSALMQSPTTLSATMQGRESSTGFTENEREVYNRELENRLKAEEKLTKRRRTQIEEQLNQDFERGYVNAQNIRDILGDRIDLQKDTRLAESFNEETRRTQAYENDVSKYDEKQRKVIQTAIDSGLLNNSNKTHDMVDLIAKLSADKGVDFDFTNNERIKDSGFAIDGRQVNGFVKDGTVNLNLESNQVLNKTVGHEITHVLEGTELYDNLQQSLKAYIGEKEWNNRISQLEKVYQNVKGANIENELTSDLVGEHIFNDENFIRNLSTKNPNLFQKIFDEIKYMVKIATAGSKEARDLEKVKRAFEKAYRETSKTQEGTQYSVSEEDLEKYVYPEQVYEAYKNEDKSKITQTIDELEEYKKTLDTETDEGWSENINTNAKIKALENGYESVYDYYVGEEKKRLRKEIEGEYGRGYRALQEGIQNEKKNNQLQQDIAESTDFKNAQFQVIQNSNPMFDDYHVGIRSPKDIKTFSQAIEDEESFAWGDYTKEDAERDLARDRVTIYSSYPIKQGVFVSTSRIQAEQYAGGEGNQVYSKTVRPEKVAWISGDEGQYASVRNKFTEDIKYSLSVQEANTTQDNEGRKLTDNQLAYFKDSKAVDENGNLVTVYHTTTEKVPQFNEFNPTGTDYYKFGDQVVNYFTDDKNMSGSYADQYYEMADTKKITSLEEANEFLKKYNDNFNKEDSSNRNADFIIKKEDGKYNLYNNVEQNIVNSAKEFINTLDEEGKEFIKKYLQDGASKTLFEDRYGLTPEQENYINQYEDWAFNQYSPKSLSHAPQNYLAMLLMDTYHNKPVASYNNETELFKNLKTDLQKDNYDSRNRLQYQGYANITNPYIIDAEGRTWNKVESKADSDFTKELMKVTPEDRQYLEDLASDSIKTYNDNLFNYQQAERAVNDFAIDRTNTTLEQRLVHRTIHDLGFEDFMKVLNNEPVFWGRKETFMDDMFNNGIASYQERQQFNKTGNIPQEVLDKVDKLIHEPAKYEDRYMKRELEALNMPPEIKTTTIYDLWNNQQEAYKTFDEGGRYEYSKFNNVVNEKNLYRALDNEALFKVAKKGFTDENIRLLYNDWSVTNDIVKSIIDLNKVGENYDGVIIKNVIDYGGKSEVHEPHDLYITFNSNQFKAVDNLNPTNDADIRYQLGNNELAPTSGWNVRSEDVRLQSAFKDAIAPIQEQVQQLTDTMNRLEERIAPVEETAEKSQYPMIDKINDFLWKLQGKKDKYYGLTKPDFITEIANEERQQRIDAVNNLIDNLSKKITDSNNELNINDVKDQLTTEINNYIDEYRPLTEQEGEQLAEEYANRDISKEIAPVNENLTEEENQRLAVLDLLERNNMLDEEHQYERDQLLEKANPTIPNEEATPGQALEDIRDMDEVGKRDVKSYQYEHPEVKPYFQEEARGMLSDLQNSQKGERIMWESTEKGQGTNWEVKGIKRFTSPVIAELLDSKWGYTYKDIEKGLKAIIEDHGAENIAVAKRIEFILDDNLRNGYTDWQTGMEIPPNQDYLNMLAEQEWNEYYDNIQEQYPLEPYTPVEENVPDYYSIEDEDVSDMKIDKDLQDMTADDINLEPFLEGLQKASDRQAEREQLREELNQKKEVKIPKETNGRKAWNKFKSLFVNEFAVVDDYAKRHNAPEIKHKTDTWNNYLAAAQYNIENAQTDMNGKAIGRSGNSIFQEAQKLGLKDTFDTYLKHWANVDRAKQGKGANYEAKESYKIVKEMEAKNPELKRLGKDMWQYYRNARHNLRDAGIINQQTSDMLGRMYPHYTPYVSENIENYFTPTGELKPKSTIKRAKGGAVLEGLLSAEEAMQMYTKSQFNTIFGNDVFKSIVNTSNNQVEMVDNRTSYVNADNLYTDKDGYYLTAYENGDAITAKISEEMYKALSRESKTRVQDLENTFRPVGKVLSTLSNIRRNILTSWSPTFIAKNFIKDYQEALFNSKYTADFAKNYPSAFKELATNTGEAQQFKALYGSGLTMGQFDMDSINYNPNAKNFNFLKGIKNANELIELAPRYAEFKASRENGASIQEAMYNAREVTTNFSRGGVITKAFNKYGMTFLNSSVQGFDKFVRNFSGENGAKGVVNSLAKSVIFGIAPAVFNELAFGSGDDKDEEYEAIPDYIKDNYYIIKTGNGNFIRIPKGRVFSVFGSAARRTIEMMEGEENAFDGFLENTQQQIGINNPEENNIFAPFIQAMGGRKLDSGQTAGSAWYGGDIIPSRLQKERPEDQYDASIDKFSIWLGKQTGISPYKINYVLDQYSGGIGDLILPMITDEANSDGSIIAPIKDQFTADSTTDNKYVSEFYDTKGKLYTGSKATDEDKLKNMYMNHISMGMSQLYAERREVQASDLPKKEKYAKSQEIKKEINRLAKIGLDGYNNIEVTGNYAVINDDMGYYKNANGEWKPIPQNDITYTESEGLTDNEKSAYYGLKNDIYNINKEYEDESLNASTEEKRILNAQKKNEIIDTIKSSNLDDNTKAYIYSKKYGDKKIQSFINSGIDVNSYLDYKQQDFSADKDRNGKSISGSKKRKVFDYINSMNIPYEQKLILAKSEYNSFNQNNYDIINYIENSGMSYDERIELYKNLGFKVDGDNISW